MDGTGAERADPTGNAEKAPAGTPSTGTATHTGSPARPVGRADVTGPLPAVLLPTDATGPLPAGALPVDTTGADVTGAAADPVTTADSQTAGGRHAAPVPADAGQGPQATATATADAPTGPHPVEAGAEAAETTGPPTADLVIAHPSNPTGPTPPPPATAEPVTAGIPSTPDTATPAPQAADTAPTGAPAVALPAADTEPATTAVPAVSGADPTPPPATSAEPPTAGIPTTPEAATPAPVPADPGDPGSPAAGPVTGAATPPTTTAGLPTTAIPMAPGTPTPPPADLFTAGPPSPTGPTAPALRTATAEPVTTGIPTAPVAGAPAPAAADLFTPAAGATPPTAAPAAPAAGAPAAPTGDLFTSATPDAGSPAPPPAQLFAGGPPSAADLFTAVAPAPGDGSPPVTTALPVVGPSAAGPQAVHPPAGQTHSAFSPALGQAATGPIPALTGHLAQAPTAPAGRASMAPPPTGVLPVTAPPSAPPSAPPATGVLPRIPPAQTAQVATVAAPAEAATATGAWSFAPTPSDTRSRSFTPGEQPSDDTQAWPLPTPGGAAHAGPGIPAPDSPPSAARTARKHRVWPLTLVGVLVAATAGIALAVSLVRTTPGELIATAAAAAGDWNGTHVQGAVPAQDGGEIQFDLTVTADGSRGTMTRDGGQATAEIVRDGSGTLLKANRNWWLYHHPTRANDLADTWLADPLTETREIAPLLGLHPQALAQHLQPERPPAHWEAVGEQQVEGQDGVVLFDGARRVVVSSAAPHPLLALDVGPASATAPARVTDISPEEAATAASAAAGIRNTEAPKTLAQRLLERPVVAIQLQPEPLCVAETCNVTITVTNSGTAPARGRLEVTADGHLVATHPLDVHPGQVATFTATAPNPQFATPGATGQILWESRAIDG